MTTENKPLNGMIPLYVKAHYVLLRDFLEKDVRHSRFDRFNVKKKLSLLLDDLQKEAIQVSKALKHKDELEENALQMPFYHISTIIEGFLNILVRGLYNKEEETIKKLHNIMVNFDKIIELKETPNKKKRGSIKASKEEIMNLDFSPNEKRELIRITKALST